MKNTLKNINNICNNNIVRVCCIPGHTGINGNEKDDDELTRNGSSMQNIPAAGDACPNQRCR